MVHSVAQAYDAWNDGGGGAIWGNLIGGIAKGIAINAAIRGGAEFALGESDTDTKSLTAYADSAGSEQPKIEIFITSLDRGMASAPVQSAFGAGDFVNGVSSLLNPFHDVFGCIGGSCDGFEWAMAISSITPIGKAVNRGYDAYKVVSRVTKSTVQANKAAGDAARDAIAARTGGVIEQNFRVTGGLRRVDVLDGTIAIESKVGRTGLTKRVRQELARDVKMLRSGQVDRVQWEFSRSGVTGKSGPTGPLRQKLEKFGIDIIE